MTTNLDAQRPVLWNMGAIAASGRPDALQLFREILLASSSIPGIFPPVMIRSDANGTSFSEMHVDGSASTPIYANPELLAGQGPLGTSTCRRRKHLWLLINNTQPPEFKIVPDRDHAALLRDANQGGNQGFRGSLLRGIAAARCRLQRRLHRQGVGLRSA